MTTRKQLLKVRKILPKTHYTRDQFKKFIGRTTGIRVRNIIEGGGSLGKLIICYTNSSIRLAIMHTHLDEIKLSIDSKYIDYGKVKIFLNV